jgi:hypothetical protein
MLFDPGAEEAVRDRCVVSPPLRIAVGGKTRRLGKQSRRQAELVDHLAETPDRGVVRWMDATLIAASVKEPPYGSGGMNPRDPVHA